MIDVEELVRLEDDAAKTDHTMLSIDTISYLQTYLIEVCLFGSSAEINCSLSGVNALAGHEGDLRSRGETLELLGLTAAGKSPGLPDRRS